MIKQPSDAIALTDLDAAAFLVAHNFPVKGIERSDAGYTVFRFDPEALATLGSFYQNGLVRGQSMGAALRQLKKAIHMRREDTHDNESRSK